MKLAGSGRFSRMGEKNRRALHPVGSMRPDRKSKTPGGVTTLTWNSNLWPRF